MTSGNCGTCGGSDWPGWRRCWPVVLLGVLFGFSASFPAVDSFAAAGAPAELVINSMHSDPAAKRAFDEVVKAFQVANPDIKVTVNTVDHESYKVQIRTWLPNTPPDVATWFTGNRAAYFVEKGLVEPIDDVWQGVSSQFLPAMGPLISFHGHAYLMPTTYYNWGFFYRRDLFARAGVHGPPATWAEFLAAMRSLKAKGITPIALGSKDGWPAAAWFDFLNLRTNGPDFHRALMRGEASYVDGKVLNAMNHWRELLDLGAFPSYAAAMTWQEASALIWQGRAAMELIGNFFSANLPAGVGEQIGFFPFPIIDQGVSVAELAPTDCYFIPARAKHKATAKRFLAFVATPEAQRMINISSGQLPPNLKTPMDGADRFQQAGQEVLGRAAALMQFFDRDAHPEVAKVAMDGFVEFMAYPDRVQKILSRIDAKRVRVHGR